MVLFVESQQINERFISDPGAHIFQQKLAASCVDGTARGASHIRTHTEQHDICYHMLMYTPQHDICEGRTKSMPSIGNMMFLITCAPCLKAWFWAKPCWTRSNHYHQSNFNFHVINACWSSVPRMRKEPGYGTSRVAVASKKWKLRAVLLPVAFASDLNEIWSLGFAQHLQYQGATTRAMLCRLCVAQCVVMFLFVTLTNWSNDFKHLLKAKAYVWDVSLPFVFLFMSACGFSLLMLTFGKRYHPLTT